MAKLRLKQLENVLTGSLNISGSLGVSGSALTIDGAGTVSGSALSSGSFGRLNSYTLDIDSIQGDWTNAGNTVADLGVVTTVDINGGTIDGTDVTVGAGKTLDVSGGTLTLANDQISGDNIQGGTIGSTTITTLDGTTIKDFSTISGSAISTGSFGVLQVPQTHGIDFLSGGGGTTHKWRIFNSSSDIFEISSIAYGGSPITIDATGGGVNVAANLDVGNGVDVTGDVITTGNVSGSFTSTGSFASLKIIDAHQGDLLIQGDSSTAQLKIRPNVNTGDSELLFSRPNRANAGFIEYGHSADSMNFYAAGPALRFALNSSGASINQALSVGTDITLGGDISGSATSTATFGSYGGNISGSATSTGSFGELHIDDRIGVGTTNPTKELHVVGDALVTGILTAQEFHTEFVSASIQFTSGSTKFGDTSDDIHSLSGSLRVTGSGDHYFTDGRLAIGTSSPSANLHLEADEPEFFIKHTGTSGNDKTKVIYGDKHGQVHAQLFTQLKDDTSGGPFDSEFHIQTAADGTLADRIVVEEDGKTIQFPTANASLTGSSTLTGSFGLVELLNTNTSISPFKYNLYSKGNIQLQRGVTLSFDQADYRHGFIKVDTSDIHLDIKGYYGVKIGSQSTDSISINQGGSTTEFNSNILMAAGKDISGSATTTATFGNYGGNISGSATSTGSFGELHIKDRVGIGTTTPSASLHVEGSILVDVYEQGGDELTGGIFFREGYGTSQPSITVKAHNTNPDGLSLNAHDGISFRTNDTERARITQTGDFGITGSLNVTGNISGSATHTGSFGSVETAGNINSSGRIFEQNTSVIDHATAMAIVFGG